MSWTDRLFAPGAARSNETGDNALTSHVDALIDQQKASWPQLREGWNSLQQVRTKRLESPHTPGSYVVVQHNPARVRSTAARVDRASIQSRKCFLCPQNLPPEERVIEYGDFVIACNPFPVLERHLSIIHRRHIEQKIDGHVGTLLALARDLGPAYLVLYNGPRCGASAPDHLHLQACSRGLLPIQATAAITQPLVRPDSTGPSPQLSNTAISVLEDFGRSVIVLRGSGLADIAGRINHLLSDFASVTGSDSEPMVNMICTHDIGTGAGLGDQGFWTVYVFPRARHRPAYFFAEEDQRITVSPGAIDMAGVIVVPGEQDFARIGVDEAVTIFSEVSASPAIVRQLAARL